jgi:hypothetical protein
VDVIGASYDPAMVRAGALALVLIAGVLTGAGHAAAAVPLSVIPQSGPPDSKVAVAPSFAQIGTCELEWDGVLVPNSAFPCGPSNQGFLTTVFIAPAKPGVHTVTACTPDCSKAAQLQVGSFVVTDQIASDTSPAAAGPTPTLTVSVPIPVSSDISHTTPASMPVMVSLPTTPVASRLRISPRPVAAGSHVSPPLLAAAVALLALLALGGTLLVRRRLPQPHHANTPGPLVIVTTSARRRTARGSPRHDEHGRVGVTSRRSRMVRSQRVRRRQEFTS